VKNNEAGTACSEAPLTLKNVQKSRVSGADGIALDVLEPLRSVLAFEGQEIGMKCKVHLLIVI